MPPSDVQLTELLQSMRAQLEATILFAKQALVVAERSGQGPTRQFFQSCAQDLERTRVEAQQLCASLSAGRGTTPSESGEQVSTASFAPGDGANDAQVTPEEARGKPGNWPAY